MQSAQTPKQSAAPFRFLSDDAASGTGSKPSREIKSTVEGWEQCLKNQIISHPRIALGMGLMAGLIAGWWVKR